MSKPTPRIRTDWRERAHRFFEAHGADVAEEEPALDFHVGQNSKPDTRYIKNPCPTCGGRMFPDWARFEHTWYYKCINCARIPKGEDGYPLTLKQWGAHLRQSVVTRKGMACSKANGKQIGRPKKGKAIISGTNY